MFVVCGEALWDLFAEEAEDGLTFRARIGGSPFNVAVGLARLQTDAALMTGLSTDRLGARLDAALASLEIPPPWYDDVEIHYDTDHPWKDGRLEILIEVGTIGMAGVSAEKLSRSGEMSPESRSGSSLTATNALCRST